MSLHPDAFKIEFQDRITKRLLTFLGQSLGKPGDFAYLMQRTILDVFDQMVHQGLAPAGNDIDDLHRSLQENLHFNILHDEIAVDIDGFLNSILPHPGRHEPQEKGERKMSTTQFQRIFKLPEE